MKPISLLEVAHGIIKAQLLLADKAVDATLGNGHDTLFLAQCVGENGHVYGFDIQEQALLNTRCRLLGAGMADRVSLFHASHAEMAAYLPDNIDGQIKAIMFNLGYLPGSDKALLTRTQSTLPALDSACLLLAEQGLMTVLAYPGHEGGDREAQDVLAWCRQLDEQRFSYEEVLSYYHHQKSPLLFVIRKRANLL